MSGGRPSHFDFRGTLEPARHIGCTEAIPTMKTAAHALAAGLTLALATGDCSQVPRAASPSAGVSLTAATVMTANALQDRFRRVMLDEATWSRLYIVDLTSGSAGAEAAGKRLARARDDVAELLGRYGGPTADERLGKLLDAMTGDERAAATAAVKRDRGAYDRAAHDWYASGDRLAYFLADRNPALSETGLVVALRDAVRYQVAQIDARLAGDFRTDADAADASAGQALAIADIFAGGVIDRSPRDVAPPPLDTQAQSVHVVLRDLFETRAALLHEYVVESQVDFAAAEATRRRLLANADAIGRPLGFFYGDALGASVGTLLRGETRDALAALDAAMGRGVTPVADAKRAWVADTGHLADALARANPRLDAAVLARHLETFVDGALADALARTGHEWLTDVGAADSLREGGAAIGDLIGDAVISEQRL